MAILEHGVSISIVTYNTWDRTQRCIEAALESCGNFPAEILVHDNGADVAASLVLPSNVKINKSDHNIGFGAGNNVNLSRAKYDHFLLINPDADLTPAALDLMIQTLQRQDVAAVAPLLVYPDGRPQHSVRRLPSMATEFGRIFGLDRIPGSIFSTLVTVDPARSEVSVEQPAGALLGCRTRLLRQIGGFDETFPMYFEDVDLCKRLGDHGSILILTEPEVPHDGEGTAKKYRAETTFWTENSRKRYYGKHYTGPRRILIHTICMVSCFTHMTACIIKSQIATAGARANYRAKTRGYALALLSYFWGSDDYWRDRMMST